jgi:hypothetical protein
MEGEKLMLNIKGKPVRLEAVDLASGEVTVAYEDGCIRPVSIGLLGGVPRGELMRRLRELERRQRQEEKQ